MKISKPRSQRYTTKEPALHFSTFPANEDIENFQMSFSLIFQFKESQFLLRIVAEYIGDVIFVWSAPQKLQKKGSVNIFVTGDDRKEPLRYKEPLLHTVLDGAEFCAIIEPGIDGLVPKHLKRTYWW